MLLKRAIPCVFFQSRHDAAGMCLCYVCRRDRLAVITQLLVPLLLVVLAMAVSTLETQRTMQPPLQLSRTTCLMDKPALLAAAPGLRQQKEVQGFMDGYPRWAAGLGNYPQVVLAWLSERGSFSEAHVSLHTGYLKAVNL